MKTLNDCRLPDAFVSPACLSGLPEDTPILVGYSGGADSTALLHMLRRYGEQTGAPVYAAHVNHGIRGAEAERDEEFCRANAKALGIELFVCRADIPRLARERGESVETTARRIRYDFFEKLMGEKGIPLLVTAHNADDNLETMLFHLIRGSGLNGLCGIPVSRLCENGVLVRPILGMTRAEILDYCHAYGLSYVTDSTNVDTDYTRNKLRAEVLPRLREINDRAVENAAHLADSLRADALCLESMTNMFLEGLREGYAIETEKLNGSPDAVVNRALIALYREISEGGALEYTHVIALRRLAKQAVPHSSVTLPNGMEAVIEDQRLIFRRSPSPVEYLPYFLPLSEGSNPISHTNCEIVIGRSQNTKNIYKKSILLSIDSATINGTLIARNRQPGDRIRMGGMRKSLKKLMCDKKIPVELRSRLPVICDDDGVLAVPLIGVRDGACGSVGSPTAIELHFYL